MSEYRKKFVSLDLETTHLDAREGRIIEAAAAEVDLSFESSDGGLKAAVTFGKTFSSLINPEMAVPALALALTGIKEEELAAAPKWEEVKAKFREFLGGEVLLGHNLGFDLGFLEANGLKLKNPVWDTLEIAQTLMPAVSSHSLESLAERLGIRNDVSHRALADAQTTARLLAAVLNEFLCLPPELQKEIKGYLKASKIKFRELVLDLPVSPA